MPHVPPAKLQQETIVIRDIESRVIRNMLRQMAALPSDDARERVAQYIWARRFLPWSPTLTEAEKRHQVPDHDSTGDLLAGVDQTQPTPDAREPIVAAH
jgi:hypothetical protein